MSNKRVVLAYSGGLDTSVAVRWLGEESGAEVIALAVDVGQGGDFEVLRRRAIEAGAVESVVVDARAEMAESFVVPAIRANASYEGKYPLVSALSRPVIVRHLVAAAQALRSARRGPRVHRQGQRPGPFRGRDPCACSRPRNSRSRARCGE